MFEKDLSAHEVPPSNTPVVAIGSADMGYDGDALRLTLERVYPISTIREESVGELDLYIKSDSPSSKLSDQTEAKIIALADLIEKSPQGSTKIKISLEYPHARVNFLRHEKAVELSDEFLFKLKSLALPSLTYQMKLKQPQSPASIDPREAKPNREQTT